MVDEEFLFQQMVQGTSDIASRMSTTNNVVVADPGRYRYLVSDLQRNASSRSYSKSSEITQDTLLALLRSNVLIDEVGRCSVASSGNIQGIETLIISSEGGVPIQATPGRSGWSQVLAADGLRKAILEQMDGLFWVVLLYVDPRPYIERYGPRAFRYIFMEAGMHSGMIEQSVQSAGWGGCIVGGFDDSYFRWVLGTCSRHLMPVSLFVIGELPRRA